LTPNGGEQVRPIIKSLPLSIAAAALVSMAAAGCATTATQAGFRGYIWQVIEIDHAGEETPIAPYSDDLMFAPNGDFVANEPINTHFGSYHQTRGGFTTTDMAETYVEYVGHDPVVLLSIGAISAFDNGVHSRVQLTGNRLTVTVGGYRLICQRDGTYQTR